MKKKMKVLGRAIGINFTDEEMEIYQLKEGRIYDVELVEVKNGKTKANI